MSSVIWVNQSPGFSSFRFFWRTFKTLLYGLGWSQPFSLVGGGGTVQFEEEFEPHHLKLVGKYCNGLMATYTGSHCFGEEKFLIHTITKM